MREGLIVNNEPSFATYLRFFAYSETEALKHDRPQNIDESDTVPELVAEANVVDNALPQVEANDVVDTAEDAVQRGNDARVQRRPTKYYQGKGRRPIPRQLVKGKSDRERKAAENWWKRLTDKQQRIEEQNLKAKEAQEAANSARASARAARLAKRSAGETSTTSPAEPQQPAQESGRKVQPKRAKDRAVGTAPETKAQMKDKETLKQKNLMMSRLFTYISMTTPPKTDARGRSTSDWPQLLIALIIVDEYKPNPPKGKHKDGKEKRDKPLITFVAASEKVKNEVIVAIQDGYMLDSSPFFPTYDRCVVFSEKDAVNAEYFGFGDETRKRPPQRVRTHDEILQSLSHFHVAEIIMAKV